VNLECKVIGVPQPVLKWYKDNVELKPGDIHRIISGQDGTCCLGIYTCEATNCMGTVSSSASLLGFEGNCCCDTLRIMHFQSGNRVVLFSEKNRNSLQFSLLRSKFMKFVESRNLFYFRR